MRASVMIGDPEQGEPPEVFVKRGARYAQLPFKQMAKAIPGSWPNMIALGLAARLDRPARGIGQGRVAEVAEKRRRGENGRQSRRRRCGIRRRRRRAGGAAPLAGSLPPRPGRCALADHRQPGRRLRRGARRRALLRRLSDHAGDRSAGMAGAGAAQGRRRPGAGRGRTGLDQHDHRRLLRRRALADGHRRTGPVADDRSASGWRSPPKCRSWSST